jgi:predicted metalloprotease
MNLLSTPGGRVGAAALLLATFAPAQYAHAAGVEPARRPARVPSIEVTRRDVTASNKKVGMAYGALIQMWTDQFKRIGEHFTAPRIARYEGDNFTACGLIRADNAEYCPDDNTIYYDEVFVAGMQKLAGNQLATDGDMAGVGIIAHEMGHAVAIQLGHESRSSYQNESTADCLAGAFTQESQRNGSLEKGDIDEAFYGISMSGDPTLRPTGNARRDAMMQAQLARYAHGTKDQRLDNFRRGLNGGPAACLADFQ